MLLDHSLQDNPPPLTFPAGHFVNKAIADSSEFAGVVGEILEEHIADGPGTYKKRVPIYCGSGDLKLGINNATIDYTLVLNADHTYTLSATLIDKYDFSFSWNYYQYAWNGPGLTAAVNMAWASQHLSMIENYKWTAPMTPMTPITGEW